jgi:ABC-type phosphate/phosphonate transport system ATPase subunit
LSFLIEAVIQNNSNIVVIGESGTGKSWILRSTLLQQAKKFAKKLVIQPVVLYMNSTIDNIIKLLDSNIEKKRKGVYTPHKEKNLIVMIEDLHMAEKSDIQNF